MLFVADLVGDLERPHIASLRKYDTSSAVHYAIYDGEGEECRPHKLVLLNTEFYDGSSERTSHDFDVGHLLGSQHLCFRRLTGPKSASRDGLTWAGQSVQNYDGTVVGSVEIEEASGGTVNLLASEGAVVEPCGYS